MRVQPNRSRRYNTRQRNFVNIINQGEIKKFYKSKHWRDIRLQALQRDKFECQKCNCSFGSNDEVQLTTATEVHHIKPIKEYVNPGVNFLIRGCGQITGPCKGKENSLFYIGSMS